MIGHCVFRFDCHLAAIRGWGKLNEYGHSAVSKFLCKPSQNGGGLYVSESHAQRSLAWPLAP